MQKNIIIIFICLLTAQFITAQCYPDRHSTNFFDGWVSCETAQSPNPERGPGHFIMYDFGKVYKLGQMTVWNSNDPAHLDWGMRDIAIDYSTDGEHWYHAGDFTLSQASGLSTYEGGPGPHLNDVEGRYLLITGVNNYGGECYGLSEVRVSAEEVIISDVEDVEELECVDVSLYPNPFNDRLSVGFSSGCNGDIRYTIYDALGRAVSSHTVTLSQGKNTSVELGRDLPAGSYMLHIAFGGQAIQRSIIKMGKT